MLGTGQTKIDSPLGLVDLRTNGAWSRVVRAPRSKKYLNLLLSPSVEVPSLASYYVPWWEHVFAAIDKQAPNANVSSAVLLCGEPEAIDAALLHWKTPIRESDQIYYEMDAGTLVTHNDGWALTGSHAAFQNYDPAGPPIIQAMDRANELQSEWDNDVDTRSWERPVLTLVFRNIHRAHQNWQAVLSTLAEDGSILMGDGRKVTVSGAQIVFTAPTIRPIGAETKVNGPEVISGLREFRNQTGQVFPEELLSCAEIIHFPEPKVQDLIATASAATGRACLINALNHNSKLQTTIRHYGDTDLTADVIAGARLDPGMSWGQKVSKITESAARFATKISVEAVKATGQDVPPLPMGTVWGMSTDGTIGFTTIDLAELPTLKGNFSLPADIVEASGIPVPPSAYWGDLDGIDTRVKSVILGQDVVLDSIFGNIKGRLTRSNITKPVISAILIGPTGTGKTALPRAIAKVTGHNEVKIDCNTISSEQALNDALFGSDEGSLAVTLRRNPASIVILDEVDKAPQSIWNRLMTALETGEIRDTATGCTVNLRHAMIFMTSNYLAKELSSVAGELLVLSRNELDSKLRQMLSEGAAINDACLERMDGAYLMMPLEGESAFPLWKKFFRHLLITEHPDIVIGDMPGKWAETRHLDTGSPPGARARFRSAEELIAGYPGNGYFRIVLHEGKNIFTLTEETRAKFTEAGGTPRSERQRLWATSPTAKATLQERYLGNAWQVDMVMDSIAIAGMKVKPRGPVSTILLCGPTGGGKTFLAEQLARTFGKGAPIKIECQQYKTAEDVSTMLFGDKHGNGGALTKSIILKKDRVVTFDEFSRADKSLMDQIMNVLDEGRALDTQTGLPVDMKQSLFILTTNECADEIEANVISAGLSGAQAEAAARAILVKEGVLDAAHAERLTLVLPVSRQDSPAAERLFVTGVIREVFSEFGHDDADTIDRMVTDCVRLKLAAQGARAVRRWAESLFSSTPPVA